MKITCQSLYKLLWIVFLLNIASVGFCQNLRQVKDYYDKERIHIKQLYHVKQNSKKTLLEGEFTSFYQNGNVQIKGFYRNNQPEQEWSYFYESGKLRSKGSYQEGKKKDKWLFYYENQNLQSEGFFENDQKQGKWLNYYENGKLKSSGEMCAGNPCGTWKHYYEDGTLKATTFYDKKSGKALQEQYHTNGKLKAVGWLKYEKSDSTWRYYDENGKLQAVGNEKDGKKQGEWQFFYSDSSLSAIGNYEKGVPQGTWKYFYPNGNLKSVGKFENGIKNGNWRTFYTNGKLESNANFAKGTGEYKEYYENGTLKVSGYYENGKKQNNWKYYEQNGKLFAECNFKQNIGQYKGYHEDGSLRTKGVIEGDKKIGTWELYHPDGSLAGYYKPYYENENQVETENQAIVTNNAKTDTLPKGNIVIILPKKKSRYFRRTPSDKRYLLVGTNPLLPLFSSITANVEYLILEKMGYAFNVRWHRSPLFRQGTTPSINQTYEQSVSLDFAHKFYHPDNGAGSLYFGYEMRIKEALYQTTLLNNTFSPTLLETNETAFETLLIGGDKLLHELGRKRNYSLDMMLGLGIGTRWQRNQNEQEFAHRSKNPVYLAYRLSFVVAIALN